MHKIYQTVEKDCSMASKIQVQPSIVHVSGEMRINWFGQRIQPKLPIVSCDFELDVNYKVSP